MNKHHKETLVIAEHILRTHGHSVKRSAELNLEYVFLVDNKHRVAVRMSNLHTESSPFFQFKISNFEEVDYALLIGVMANQSLRIYIIPRAALKMHMRVGIGYKSQYGKFIDAWGMINSHDSCPFASPKLEDCRMCPKQKGGWCEACKQWCHMHRKQFEGEYE